MKFVFLKAQVAVQEVSGKVRRIVDELARVCVRLGGSVKRIKENHHLCVLSKPRDLVFEVGYDLEHDRAYFGVRDEKDRYVAQLMEKMAIALAGFDADYAGTVTGKKEEFYNEDYHVSMERVSHGWLDARNVMSIEYIVFPPSIGEEKPEVSIFVHKFIPKEE